MHCHDFDIHPRGGELADKLAVAIATAADEGKFLILEPGDYPIETPIAVRINVNLTRPWGVLALGARLVAQWHGGDPVLLVEATGSASVRFMTIDGLGITGQGQHGLVLRAMGAGMYLYSFNLQRLSIENCDDAVQLRGNVFEGDLSWCQLRGSQCGLALGNTDSGVLSSINIFGGSFSQNHADGLRTFASQPYREPWDFSVYGTYIGHAGRYAINAGGGFTLLKGARLENPWNEPAAHDPGGSKERAAIRLCNFGTVEQTFGGGNGNGTALVDGYLSGVLTLRDCSMKYWGSDPARTTKLAKLDGNPSNAYCRASNSPGDIQHTTAVRVSQVT